VHVALANNEDDSISAEL